MANEGLRAELASLEAELSRLRRIQQELERELAILVGGIVGGYTTMRGFENNVHATLNNASNSMVESGNRIIAAHELQGQIDKLYVRYKQVELSNKKIRAANNKIYYDFAAFRMTRRIVQSLMDNLETGFVSDRVMYRSIEKEQLKAPDYWLTAALIAVMAWRNDDPALTARAVARAVTLDKKMTSIFFMMFNIRCDREAAALEWFKAYQTCSLRGSDERTLLMLATLASKSIRSGFSETGDEKVMNFFEYLIKSRMDAEGFSDEAVADLVGHELTRFSRAENIDYPLLHNKVSGYDRLTALMSGAGSTVRVHDYYATIAGSTTVERSDRLKEFIDELVAAPNKEEINTYEEIEYSELIIRLQGDIDTAKVQWEHEQQEKQADLNLINDMVKWVYDSGNTEVDDPMRRNMLMLTMPWHKQGVKCYLEKYRSWFTTKWQLNLESYKAEVDFEQEDQELGKISACFAEKAAGEMAALKDTRSYLCFGGAGVFLVLGIVLAITQKSIAGLGACVVIAVAGALLGFMLMTSNKNERKRIGLRYQAAEAETQNSFRALVAEFARFRHDYEERDAFGEKALDLLDRM